MADLKIDHKDVHEHEETVKHDQPLKLDPHGFPLRPQPSDNATGKGPL
jgi:hypothetical protein